MGGGRHTQQKAHSGGGRAGACRDRRGDSCKKAPKAVSPGREAPSPRARGRSLARGETPVPAGCKPGRGDACARRWCRSPRGGRSCPQAVSSACGDACAHSTVHPKGTSLVIPSEPGTPEESVGTTWPWISMSAPKTS